MEVRAVAKSVRIGPRKVRLVADAIRNLSIDEAFQLLDAAEKRAALPIAKTLHSAVANAVNNAKLDKDSLSIASIQIAEGQPLKRFHPSTRGRIHPYKKRSSHITIVLKQKAGAKVAAGKSVSVKADEAVAAALHGGKEVKQSGVKALASRLTGKKAEKKGNK
jgi:large subunit ribosomal protein L22